MKKDRNKTVVLSELDDGTYSLRVEELDRTNNRTYPIHMGSGKLKAMLERAQDELNNVPF